jgi:hypothetical protein
MRCASPVGWLACALVSFAPAAPAAAAEDRSDLQRRVDRAIDRGTAYLKELREKRGLWTGTYHAGFGSGGRFQAWDVGLTSLAGLTLLQCKVAASEKAVQQAVKFVRANALACEQTYSISLAIMFLAELGEKEDVPLIESLGIRLLAGQNRAGWMEGGWSYYCRLNEAAMEALKKDYKKQSAMIRKGKLPEQALSRTVRDLAVTVNAHGGGYRGPAPDNSNTQFAVLALWIARRTGLPVNRALVRVGAGYRRSQRATGSWSYLFGLPASPPSRFSGLQRERPFFRTSAAITCAGLLGLAVAHGARGDLYKKRGRVPDLDPDDAVRVERGFDVLETAVGDTGDGFERLRRAMRGPQEQFYFLWSLERVGVIYGIQTIGKNKKDWYAWGAQAILDAQSADGSWNGAFSDGGADTCFALLFLSRSNVARDLTAMLKGRVREGGEASLRSGGVGGGKLVGGASGRSEKPRPKVGRQPPPAKAKRPAPKPQPIRPKEESARLGEELARAEPAEQERIIDRLKKGKGAHYTEALAAAIVRLEGSVRTKARAALVERLARMSAGTLRDKLGDDNLEIRRAAALACAKKGARAHVPDLIPLLEDAAVPVAAAAEEALKKLTGKDFGPGPDATRAERRTAVDRWQAWWKKQAPP